MLASTEPGRRAASRGTIGHDCHLTTGTENDWYMICVMYFESSLPEYKDGGGLMSAPLSFAQQIGKLRLHGERNDRQKVGQRDELGVGQNHQPLGTTVQG